MVEHGDGRDYVLSKEDIALLRRGREYEALVNSPVWKLLLDWMDEQVNSAMREYKLCLSDSPMVQQAFKLKWRWREEMMGELQKHVFGAVEGKRRLVQLLLNSGLSVEQLDNALSDLKPSVSGQFFKEGV